MKKEYLLFLVLPISQIMMIAGDYEALKNMDVLGSVGIILSIIADLVLLYVLIHGSKKEKLEKELERVRYLNEIESERNSIMEKRQKELVEMKDSFEKRIAEINDSLAAGDKERAEQDIDKLQEELDRSRPNTYCKHAVVNAVLSEKEKVCKGLGFSLDTDLMIPAKLEVEPLNMCSIFSNLLDNAIEAVEALPENKRKISVHGEMKGNYLFVKVENPATKEHAQRKRRKERGYGTQILEDIAKKYDGQYVASFENGVYAATVGVKAV